MPSAYDVLIKYGEDFAFSLNLNDRTNYFCKPHSANSSPEQSIELSETEYASPFVQRVSMNERVLSINFTIKAEPFTFSYYTKLNAVKKALGNGPIRLVLTRQGIGDLLIEAESEQLIEGGHPCDFEIHLLSADPVWTLLGTEEEESITIGSSPVSNPEIPFPPYVGTAPTEPVVTFEVDGHSGVWRYYRDITITNRSTLPLSYYPVCIDLGDISAQVGTKFFEVGGGNQRIKDIRLESQGGAAKQFYQRDIGERGGTWHTSVKLWTVIYSLQPDESKVLRVLYGNSLCSPLVENSTVKPMFNMYDSNNGEWIFADFLPAQNQSQERNMPWGPYTPNRMNMDWIKYPHPHFDNPNAPYVVPCAGGKVQYFGRGRGFAGVGLNLPVPIASVDFDYQFSTNIKAPLVLRRLYPDGRYFDDWSIPDSVNILGKSVYAQLAANALTGYVNITLDMVTRGGDTFAVNDRVAIKLDNGSTHRSLITAVNTGTKVITLQTAMPSNASIGNRAQQFQTGSTTVSFPTTDYPYGVVFGLRVDLPEYNLGDWYYGAANTATINFQSSKTPGVTAWGSATEVDLTVVGYQLSGRFGNPIVGEYVGVHTILSTVGDKLVVDCKNRSAIYYHWNGSGYDEGVDRFEALYFDEEVRRYWVHVAPIDTLQSIEFIADSQSNFSNITVTARYPIRYL